jgi:hypothetical protein
MGWELLVIDTKVRFGIVTNKSVIPACPGSFLIGSANPPKKDAGQAGMTIT